MSPKQLTKIIFTSMITCSSLLALAHAENKIDLKTTAEKTGWKQTGRYDEVIRLCTDFERRYPKQVRCVKFGVTPEGRAMMALVASSEGFFSADSVKERNRPVIFFQGGIHAGEIDGKDAGFWFLRNVLDGKELPQVLSTVTLVFVPVVNVDGHERFGANNRPNQVGPQEMGWRTTGQNLNMNRDYAKTDSPEMQALLKLLVSWNPILYVDLHVTDGAEFQHDVAPLVRPSREGGPLAKIGQKIQAELMSELKKKNHLPVDFYPSLDKDDDPMSGFKAGISPPRFSDAYWDQHNRFGVLVETHSWKPYAHRVKTMYDILVVFGKMAERDGTEWLKATLRADQASSELGGHPIDLMWETTEKSRKIDFLGYEFTRELSPVSGTLVTRYNTKKPMVWKLPFYDELKPTLTVTAPTGGYLVPPAHASWVAAKLGLHGIEYATVRGLRKLPEMEVFRASEVTFSKTTYEGHTTAKFKGGWTKENREIPDGSLYVPIDQPLARLVVYLFEPQSPDSYAAWGFFNSHFEKKEYMENYVAEEFAAGILKRNPALREEFFKKLEAEPEFAKSPEERLEFFYRKHPSWDDRYNLYPVYRIASKL